MSALAHQKYTLSNGSVREIKHNTVPWNLFLKRVVVQWLCLLTLKGQALPPSKTSLSPVVFHISLSLSLSLYIYIYIYIYIHIYIYITVGVSYIQPIRPHQWFPYNSWSVDVYCHTILSQLDPIDDSPSCITHYTHTHTHTSIHTHTDTHTHTHTHISPRTSSLPTNRSTVLLLFLVILRLCGLVSKLRLVIMAFPGLPDSLRKT